MIYLVYFRQAEKDISLRKVMHKQSKQTIVESEFTKMAPIFTDTFFDAVGGATTWEVIYNRLEDEYHKIIVTKATTDSTRPSGLQWIDASWSFLYRIGERAKILPYIDMIKWVIKKLIIEDRQFNNSRMEVIRSFRAEDLKKMYHIPDPQDIHDNTFVANFAKKNPDPSKLI